MDALEQTVGKPAIQTVSVRAMGDGSDAVYAFQPRPWMGVDGWTRALAVAIGVGGTLLGVPSDGRAAVTAIPVEELPQGKTVDFATDVFPFLSDNCVSCHSKSTRKGGLNLETAEDMLKGGDSGPAVVAGKAQESAVLKASRHEDADSAMPPRDNKVKAKNLTPAQLGMLKRWIELGAKPGRAVARELKWQPLPAHLRSILAVAVSADGSIAACARGNQVFVYETASNALLFRTEAHQDQVQALAFSPDGTRLASGGFREIKLWRRQQEAPRKTGDFGVGLGAVSESGEWLALSDGTVTRVREAAKPDAAPLEVPFGFVPSALAWSADASALAAVGPQKQFAVWDRAKGQLRFKVELPLEGRFVTWRNAGKTVCTAGGEPKVREWDAMTGSLVKERAGLPAEVVSLASAEGKLAAGCSEGSVWVWDADQEQPLLKLKAPNAAGAVAVSTDGARVAVAGADAAVRLYDATGKLLATVKGDPAAQTDLDAGQKRLEMEDGTLAYRKETLAEADKSAASAKDRVKKTADSLPVKAKELETKQKALADAVAALPALQKAVGDADAAFKAAEEAQKAAEKVRADAMAALDKAKATTPPIAEEVAAAEKALVDAGKALEAAQNALKPKEAARKPAADALEAGEKKRMTAAADVEKAERAKTLAETELELSKTEEKQTAADAVKAKADLAAQEALKAKVAAEVETLKKKADAAPAISALSLSHSNGVLLVGHANGLVQVRSAGGGGLLGAFGERREKGGVRSLSAKGNVYRALSEDGAAWAWNAGQKWVQEKVLGNVKNPDLLRDRVLALAFSEDGALLAAGTGDPSREGELLVWKTAALDAAPRRLAGVHSDTILSLAFSPDAKMLVSGGADKVARLINLETLKVERTLEGHTHHVLGVSWSPDGRSIVTAGADNVLKVWEASSGVRKKNVDGADKEVTAVQFLTGGAQFVAASGDGKVRVVGTNGTVVRTMAEGTTFLNAMNAAKNGRAVFVGGQDGVLRMWNPQDGAKLAEFAEAK